MDKLSQFLNWLIQMIRRFVSWWWGIFSKQGIIGKLIFGSISLCIVCFLCSLPSAILSPSPTPTPQTTETETQAETNTTSQDTSIAEDTQIPTDTPIPTNAAVPELSFDDIIQNPDEKGWTRTQYSAYLETIMGQHISGWSGTIIEIDEFAGDNYISIDIESGEPRIDAYVYINKEDILKVGLGQNVTFAGVIKSDWNEPNGFHSLQIRDAVLLELGEIPTPTLEPPTPTPKPTNTPSPEPTVTPTETPISKEDFIASASNVTYEEVSRSDRHIGELVCWTGQVFDIAEQDDRTAFQAWYFEGRHVDSSDLNAFVTIYEGLLPDVYEETEVMACGEITEKFEGVNAFGAPIALPAINAQFVDLWEPAPLPTAPPTVTPTPLPKSNDYQVQKQVGNWAMALYDVKRAKTVYFFGNPNTAAGVWFIPFVEFTNLGSGTRAPWEDLDFYLQDDQGRTFEITYNDGTAAAAWQFQAGDFFDDIQPGTLIGVALAVDTPENLGDVWLRVTQDPNFAIYLGRGSDIPLEE
jgi:hypothetical protein